MTKNGLVARTIICLVLAVVIGRGLLGLAAGQGRRWQEDRAEYERFTNDTRAALEPLGWYELEEGQRELAMLLLALPVIIGGIWIGAAIADAVFSL